MKIRWMLLCFICSATSYASDTEQKLSLDDFKPIGRWLIMALTYPEKYVGHPMSQHIKKYDVLSYFHNALQRGSIIVDRENPRDKQVKKFLEDLKEYNSLPENRVHEKNAVHYHWKKSKNKPTFYPVGRLALKVLFAKEKYGEEKNKQHKQLLLNLLDIAGSKKVLYRVLNKQDIEVAVSDDVLQALKAIEQNCSQERKEKRKKIREHTQKRSAIRFEKDAVEDVLRVSGELPEKEKEETEVSEKSNELVGSARVFHDFFTFVIEFERARVYPEERQ